LPNNFLSLNCSSLLLLLLPASPRKWWMYNGALSLYLSVCTPSRSHTQKLSVEFLLPSLLSFHLFAFVFGLMTLFLPCLCFSLRLSVSSLILWFDLILVGRGSQRVGESYRCFIHFNLQDLESSALKPIREILCLRISWAGVVKS